MPRKPPPETPLYVKLPTPAAEKLDRAAAALGVAKKDLVAGLVTRLVDIREGGVTVGSYSFQPYDAPALPEVMTAEQAGQFLQLPEKAVIELAETGKLPGRKLGAVWRFSREALVAWLGQKP